MPRVRSLLRPAVPRSLIGKSLSPGAQVSRIGSSEPLQLLGRLQRVALVHPDGDLLRVVLDAGVVQPRPHPGGDQVGRDPRLGEGLEGGTGQRRRCGTGAESTVIPPGSFASGGIALKIPGGKFSWVSQLVSTRRPIRSGWRVTSTCDIAPPESLPTIVTSSRSSAARKLSTIAAMPGGERSASGFIAICWAPIGQSGAMQRQRSESAVDDAVPEPAVDQEAVDEDDRLALAGFAVANPPGRQARSHGAGLTGSSASSSGLVRRLAGRVTYRLYECQTKRRDAGGALRGDARGADRGGAAALRRARLRRCRHRGDRPRRRGHPRRALPPLRRQARALRGGLRSGSRSSWRERIAAGALDAGAASPLEAMRAGAEMFLAACHRARGAADRPARRPLGAGLGPLARDRRRARPRSDRSDPAGGDRGRRDRARSRSGRSPTC